MRNCLKNICNYFFTFIQKIFILTFMKSNGSRRNFLCTSGLALALAGGLPDVSKALPLGSKGRVSTHFLRLSLNCYSFNDLLRSGEITLFDVLDFCASHHLDAIDPTGYYFPGYPEIPDNEYISRFKRQAFLLGIDISGTGVRNDFTITDPEKRKEEVRLVKRWLEVSARLGAPTLRVFAGTTQHEGFARDQVFEWMAADVNECVEYGKKLGIVVAVQNHNDFLKTADDVLRLFRLVNHEWLGLNLDIGSYRTDPYEGIRKTIHLAVTWQIKENVFVNGQEQKTDYERLFKLISDSKYRGYLPLETLGAGDPYLKLEGMLKEVKSALG
jgi:sugar phosphate isomerase/epimerase